MLDDEGHVLELVREYSVDLARLWSAVTEPVQIIQWFGPEGMFLQSCEMDFRKTGPWVCTMRGKETMMTAKVSGQVTSVSPPGEGADKATGVVGFTWAWHDDDDARGNESFVEFRVSETDTGARLTLRHTRLADTDAAQGHSRGWMSTLAKMDRFFGVE